MLVAMESYFCTVHLKKSNYSFAAYHFEQISTFYFWQNWTA